MKITGYSCSLVGSREMNQDSFLVDDKRQLYAVADGVGGGQNGEVASRMAIEGLSSGFTDPHQFSALFQKLQADVLKEAMDTFGEPIMGTTLTAVHVRNDELFVCHVGDSRCYLFDEFQLTQLTEDQEYYDEKAGATVLCSYLGVPTELATLEILEDKRQIHVGQRLLLCSDGLYRQISESQIISRFREHVNAPQEMINHLCLQASQSAYSDNVTAIYIELNPL